MFPFHGRRPTKCLFASPLNPLEYKLADLNFMGRTPPVVLGLDIAGIVVSVGDDVRDIAVGDAVVAMADLNGNGGWVAMGGSGGEGGYAVARQFLTVRKTRSLSFRDAAVLPMCFLSAFAGLYRTVQENDTVYIPGGGGGVGHLAVQMAARVLGAGLVVSSGSTPQSMALSHQCGANHVFNYKHDNIVAEIAKLTAGRGVDLVFDATYNEKSSSRPRRQSGMAGAGSYSVSVLERRPGWSKHIAPSIPFSPNAEPSILTSICCGIFLSPPRWTARLRLFSSAEWSWRWTGRRRN